jgi:hypothetical protein
MDTETVIYELAVSGITATRQRLTSIETELFKRLLAPHRPVGRPTAIADKGQKPKPQPQKQNYRLSEEGRRKIIQATKKRWAAHRKLAATA